MKRTIILYSIILLGFILGIKDGRIALWQDGKQDPIQIFPYSAKLLPPDDRAMLEKGMHFDTKQQLIERIEDYLS